MTIAYRGDSIPREKLADLVPLAREASVDEDLVEDSVQRIKRYLNQQGYWKADTTVEREEGDGTLTIVFTVHKGAHYVVESGCRDRGQSLGADRAAAARARQAAAQRRLRGVEPERRGERDRRRLPEARVRPGQGECERQRAQSAGARPGPGPAGDCRSPRARSLSSARSRSRATRASPRINSGRSSRRCRALRITNRGLPLTATRSRSSIGTAASSRSTSSSSRPCRRTSGRARVDVQDHRRPADDHRPYPDHREHADRRACDQARTADRRRASRSVSKISAESQRRLGALGLFRRFRIEELAHGSAGNKDVLVTVEEAAARTFSYGGGAEVTKRLFTTLDGPEERLDLGPRGFVDLGFRNIGGRNRSLDLYSRLALHPEATASGSTNLAGFGFSEDRVVSTLREPRAIGLNADLALTAAIEQGIRSTFNFTRKGVNAEIGRRLSPACAPTRAIRSTRRERSRAARSRLRTRRGSIGCSRRCGSRSLPVRSLEIRGTTSWIPGAARSFPRRPVSRRAPLAARSGS